MIGSMFLKFSILTLAPDGPRGPWSPGGPLAP